jgi:hypothetical protein
MDCTVENQPNWHDNVVNIRTREFPNASVTGAAIRMPLLEKNLPVTGAWRVLK